MDGYLTTTTYIFLLKKFLQRFIIWEGRVLNDKLEKPNEKTIIFKEKTPMNHCRLVRIHFLQQTQIFTSGILLKNEWKVAFLKKLWLARKWKTTLARMKGQRSDLLPIDSDNLTVIK